MTGSLVSVLAKALALVAIVGIGQLIKQVGWARTEDFTLFSHIVLKVTLPASIITYFDSFAIRPALLSICVVAIVVNLGQQVLGYWLARGAGRSEQAFAVLNAGGYNIGAFAMPYISGFLGPAPVLYTSMFDVGNAVAAAGICYGWGMSLAAHTGGRSNARLFLAKVASSHLFWLYIGLAAFRLAGWHVPAPLLTFTSTVGAANPFMAMLMIGVGLRLRLERTRYHRAARYLALRYLCSVVLGVLIWTLLPMSHEARMVIVMLLFAPMTSMVSGFTAAAGLDVETSAFMTSVTIVIALVAMPLLLAVLA